MSFLTALIPEDKSIWISSNINDSNSDIPVKLYQLDLTLGPHLQIFIARLYRYRMAEKNKHEIYTNIDQVQVLSSAVFTKMSGKLIPNLAQNTVIVYDLTNRNIPFCLPPELHAYKDTIITFEGCLSVNPDWISRSIE